MGSRWRVTPLTSTSPVPCAEAPVSMPRPVPVAGIPSLAGEEVEMVSLEVIQMWMAHIRGHLKGVG